MNKDKNNFKRKNLIIILLFLVLVCCLAVSISYAYWLRSKSQTDSNIVASKCFDTSVNWGTGLNLNNAIPMSEEEALQESTPFNFSIKNVCDSEANYQVNIETIENTFKLENIRIKMGNYESSLISNLDVVEKTIMESIDSRKIMTGVLKPDEEVSYDLRVWLDKDMKVTDIPNNVSGGKNNWIGKISIITATKLQEFDIELAGTPVLYQGLIPVTYGTNGEVLVADTNTDWYNYNEHKWANAVLVDCSSTTIRNKYFNKDMSLKDNSNVEIPMDDILQMYVWIPRYRYKLFNAEDGTSNPQMIDIVFEKSTTPKSTIIKNGEYYTHPAFTFGDTELEGIWVGKFEMTGTTSEPTIKPNLKSLTNINVATMFNTAKVAQSLKYGLSWETDVHMMKNMEWGAVAYLTNSKYGRYIDENTCIESGCEVWINNVNTWSGSGDYAWGPSITGCSASSVSSGVANSMSACASGYSWNKLGINASTTGNIYGIYDMSGGAWEYVMGVMKDSTGNSITVGSSGFSAATLLKEENKKYYDLYGYQNGDSGSAASFKRYHIGDATKEVLVALFSSSPWVVRGGSCNDGLGAGLFAFGRRTGGAGSYFSFRSVACAY